MTYAARDLRDTAVWGDESLTAASVNNAQNPFASNIPIASDPNAKRHVELRITTPKGYATQTRTSVQVLYGAPLGESCVDGGSPSSYSGVNGNGITNSSNPSLAANGVETINIAE